ncbi:MAG TPA: BamA/TamA family outer membrane protein [Vicinamibacterales bacterium]|jgi:outer membrane protein assembly complex protein YaeT|nr:BamA/TamA family outer membrane protein [Vicinamibacterales bacterium]
MSRAALALTAAIVLAAGCREEEGIKVTDLSFEGVKAVSESQLKDALATADSSWLPWGTKRYFNRAQFEADLKRIVAFYADRGYPDAKVTSFDVDLNEAQSEVKLRVTVDEGQPIVVEDLRFEGFEQFRERRIARMERQASIREGAPRDLALVQATRERTLDELRDSGFPHASVQVTESPGTQPRHVVLTFAATLGPAALFGPVEIVGNSSVDDEVIRRQLTFKPGQRFRLGRLQESQRRLYGLELFEFVNVESVESRDQAVEVPVRVTVTEGKHRKLTFGFGYGTEEKLRGTVNWRHVNFFGGARTAGVEAKWSSLDRGVRLNLFEPYFLRPGMSLTASAQGWFSNEPAYELETLGGRVTLTQVFSDDRPRSARPALTTASVSIIRERENYTITEEAQNDPTLHDDFIALGLDPTTGSGGGILSAVAFDLQRTTTRNVLDARRGYVAAIHFEKAGRWFVGDFDYTELTLDGRHYLSIGRRFVLANRAKIGSLDAPDPTGVNIPFFKRYFLGGSTSLRGWGRFEVSPLSDGFTTGGLSMLEITSEARFPISGNLGGVLFVDAGNSWEDPWGIDLKDLLADVGAGVRYLTPIGPLRFDFAYQFTPIDGLLIDGEQQRFPWRVHFSIGQAF